MYVIFFVPIHNDIGRAGHGIFPPQGASEQAPSFPSNGL